MKNLLFKINPKDWIPAFAGMTGRSVLPFLISIKDALLKRSYLWVILIFAFLTRMYGIGSVGVNEQELKNIERIFSLNNPANFLNSDACTNLYYLLQNLWGKIFGYSVFNMRFLSVVLSLLGLFIFFKFTEEWFNRKLAYIGTFLLSISSFHILVSRNISHEILYPVIIITALHLLTLAYRYKMWQYFFLSGVLL
ncbi:MAG: glycosyltransferase family 39 protein, partial [Patescibacteria group bacterium]